MSDQVSGSIPPIVQVWIKTYGCQMNYHDSERMLSVLQDLGYLSVDGPQGADLIILNSCAVRELATQKFYSALGALAPYKKRGAKIGVAGCVAQIDGESIRKKFPMVDFVIGTDNIDALADILGQSTPVVANDFKDYYETTTKRAKFSHRALINIIKGCNAFCSYCIVPFARGREVSRSKESILRDVCNFANQGVKEITLLGQNVNAYSYQGENIASLIRSINDLNLADVKLKFISAHPHFFSDELVECFSLPLLANHIHLPVQSGSDKVLKDMNRRYNREFYLQLVEKIRSIRPYIAITTDIMVGLPTEREIDFEDTLRLLEEVRFDALYAYLYSPRAPAKAATLKSIVSVQMGKERLHILQNLQKKIQSELRRAMIGKVFAVLVDGKQVKNDITSFYGRTEENRIVFFPGDDVKIGQYHLVKIAEATPYSAKGIIEIDR